MRVLNRRFGGWSVWYGSATGRWWALAPRWGHGLVGLIEAGSAEELVLRMNQIEMAHLFASGRRPDGSDEAPDHPGPSSLDEAAQR
ncbi:hypothetical protein ACFFWE_14245 [Sphaerisporangium melleum]|uniref:hypothetical protein n=1 Tax=Sphaerisporangium melleum TaxID=321316 RepID=UPI001951473D|nr:hypothetical protein [Sphaerisporangium melleum]